MEGNPWSVDSECGRPVRRENEQPLPSRLLEDVVPALLKGVFCAEFWWENV